MAELFSPGDQVIWRTPAEKRGWERQYEQLIERHGHGPFTVVSIVSAPLIPHPQMLVLKTGNGIIRGVRAPALFCGSWVKKIDEKPHLRSI